MTADDILIDNGFVVFSEVGGWRYYKYGLTQKGWVGRTKIGSHTAEFCNRCYIKKDEIKIENLTMYWLVTPMDFCSFAHDVKEFVIKYKNNKQQLNIKNIQQDFE